MKLKDILARELKAWPEGVAAISQGPGSGALFDSSYQGFGADIFLAVADDSGNPQSCVKPGVAVTRAEWQAAVDALNAPKVVDWDGVGDPPAMSKIEYKSVGGTWKSGVFVGRVYGKIVAGCDDTEAVGWLPSDEMRPIRTAEQVAAEEREKAIEEMVAVSPLLDKGWSHKVCAALYDNDYRKQVAK